MPYVNIQITTGATRDQKRRLIERTTAALVEELGKAPEHIHVVIQEIDERSWGFAGIPTDEYRAKHSSSVKSDLRPSASPNRGCRGRSGRQ